MLVLWLPGVEEVGQCCCPVGLLLVAALFAALADLPAGEIWRGVWALGGAPWVVYGLSGAPGCLCNHRVRCLLVLIADAFLVADPTTAECVGLAPFPIVVWVAAWVGHRLVEWVLACGVLVAGGGDQVLCCAWGKHAMANRRHIAIVAQTRISCTDYTIAWYRDAVGQKPFSCQAADVHTWGIGRKRWLEVVVLAQCFGAGLIVCSGFV